MTDPSIHTHISQRLRTATNVLLISHIRTDGDAIGALLGFGATLMEAGKTVQLVLAEGVPSVFRFLPGVELISRKPKEGYDLTVVLDSSDLLRIGGVLPEGISPDINIDHHISNLFFGKVNLVEPKAAATSEILAEYLPKWGFQIPEKAAVALMVGVISDSIGFRTSNTTPRTLRVTAGLMELGADLPSLYFQTLLKRSFESARFWGPGLNHLQREGRILWTFLTHQDRSDTSYPGNDDADLINMLSTITDCDVTIVIVEQPSGKVKVSWRSQPGFDVSGLALKFGGGGHPAAAGAELVGPLAEVQTKILEATRQMISLTKSKLEHSPLVEETHLQ